MVHITYTTAPEREREKERERERDRERERGGERESRQQGFQGVKRMRKKGPKKGAHPKKLYFAELLLSKVSIAHT